MTHQLKDVGPGNPPEDGTRPLDLRKRAFWLQRVRRALYASLGRVWADRNAASCAAAALPAIQRIDGRMLSMAPGKCAGGST